MSYHCSLCGRRPVLVKFQPAQRAYRVWLFWRVPAKPTRMKFTCSCGHVWCEEA